MKIRVRDIINYMKPAWQVMKGTPSTRTLFLCVSANSPISLLYFLLSPLSFLHLPGRLSSNLGVFSLNGHLYQTVFSLKLTPRQCRIRGGGGVIQPLHKGGAVPPNFFFQPLRPQCGLKIRGGLGWTCNIKNIFFQLLTVVCFTTSAGVQQNSLLNVPCPLLCPAGNGLWVQDKTLNCRQVQVAACITYGGGGAGRDPHPPWDHSKGLNCHTWEIHPQSENYVYNFNWHTRMRS